MRRIIYFGYYLKKLEIGEFKKFLRYVRSQKDIPIALQLVDILFSSLKYNISIMDYFLFRFFELDRPNRKTWAGSGFMYQYQLKMNPPGERFVLDDKTVFCKSYSDFMNHNSANLSDIQNNSGSIDDILSNPSGKLVFKVADGKCGVNVLISNSKEFDKNNIGSFMEKHGYDLVEDFIVQHPSFMKLSPTAVNTVRIFTQLDVNNKVEILGCRLRISVNCSVDNLAAGNIAAPIDEHNGIVSGPAIYGDITKGEETTHPITGERVVGFQIPFWRETIDFVKAAAQHLPQNRSVGWDIAMTENGPDLIEGNHDWCRLVWQLPVKKGLKSILVRHLNENKKRVKN